MALTETTPAAAPEQQVNPWDTDEELPAAAEVLGTGDHKTIGRLWIGFALLFGVAGWVVEALTSADATVDGFLSDHVVQQLFTVGHIGFALLFAVPLFVGLATYLVPLQVGAATVAFPRAATAAFWSWLLGAVLLIVSYAIDGGVAGGRGRGVDLAYLSMALIILALCLATVCALTTLVALRTTGMALDRVPFLTWSMLVAGSIWLLSLPVLLANIILIYVDHHYGRPIEFGVADLQWDQLSWAFVQPQIFAWAIPVAGVVADIVATSAGIRVPRRGVLLVAVGAFGILSYGAWAQVYFNPTVNTQALFVGMGVIVLLPVLALAGGFATTLRQAGRLRPGAALMGAVGATLVLLLAAVASALFVIRPLELADNPYFQGGVVALVLGAVTVAGIAALHHWGPKIWGRMPNENLGRLAVTLAVLGSLVAGLALCLAGFQSRFDALADASGALNGVAAAGAALLALALLATAASLVSRGPAAHADPWGGQTLEWATASPPPPANFGPLPVVVSAEPLLDAPEAAAEEGAA